MHVCGVVVVVVCVMYCACLMKGSELNEATMTQKHHCYMHQLTNALLRGAGGLEARVVITKQL